MAFYGSEFIFDGVPCSEFGLMVYHFGSSEQNDAAFKAGNVIEDRIPNRYDALMYGLSQNEALEYALVFGANMESMDRNDSLDRYEVEAIAAWLTGHQTRKWLTIIQSDMDAFRYKCLISELELITYGDMPWAFSCKVYCDSPFAYTFPEEYSYKVSGAGRVNLFNRSSYNGYFYPKIEFTITSGDGISIQNASDGDRIFEFDGLLSGDHPTIYVDNKNQIITCDNGLNMYPYFNMNFFRMVRGDNILSITGNGTIKFICEFPINVGG